MGQQKRRERASQAGENNAPVAAPTVPARVPPGSPWAFSRGAMIALALVAAFVFLYRPASAPAPVAPSQTAGDVPSETEAASATRALAELNALRAEHLRLIHAVGDGDPEAEGLIDFHEQHARYAHLTVTRELEFPMLSAAERDRELQHPDPLRYFVVEMDREERARRGVRTNAYMAFDHTTKVMYVDRGASFQPQFAGAIILHEVRHAYDRLHGREAVWGTIVDRAPGERRAYQLETRLLRRQTAGALDALLGRVLSARGTQTACILPRDLAPADREAFRALFPGMGADDAMDYRMAMFDFAIMLDLELARRARLGEAGEIACILLAEQSPQL